MRDAVHGSKTADKRVAVEPVQLAPGEGLLVGGEHLGLPLQILVVIKSHLANLRDQAALKLLLGLLLNRIPAGDRLPVSRRK